MKFDKDTIIRNRFWILLSLFVPLVFASVLLLYLTVGSAGEEQRKRIEASEGDFGKLAKPLRNDAWVPALKIRNQKAEGKKLDIWNSAWDAQKALMTWPKGLPQDLEDKPFGTTIDESVSTGATYARPENYLKQIEEISKIVQPWDAVKGTGLVQYNGGYESVGSYTLPTVLHINKNTPWKDPTPSTEDVWLAQEDLWVQKGLLTVIQQANAAVATLRPIGDAGKNKNSGSFSNSDWKLDLSVQEGTGVKLLTKLTNVNPQKQMLGLSFRVYFTDRSKDPEELRASGEPLAANQSIDLPPKALRTVPTGIDRVEQVVDWKTVAVKRIDQVVLGVQSHRTYYRPLLRAEVFEPQPEASTAGSLSGGSGGSGSGGGAFGGSGSGGGGGSGGSGGGGSGGSGRGGGTSFGGSGGASADSDTSLNGFIRDRYTTYNQTVRRIPVAMVLIVDERHVQDVLTAFANSQLRIQTTQVGWQHYHGSIVPLREDEDAGPAAPTGPKTARPPSSPPGTATPSAAPEEQAADVVEMAIYGIATLYQKYQETPPATTSTR